MKSLFYSEKFRSSNGHFPIISESPVDSLVKVENEFTLSPSITSTPVRIPDSFSIPLIPSTVEQNLHEKRI